MAFSYTNIRSRKRMSCDQPYNKPLKQLVVGEEVRIDEDHHNEFKMHVKNMLNEVPNRMQGICGGRIVRTTQPNSKSISAFLNSYGGRIYLGIDDQGKVVGIRMSQSLIDHFFFSLYECLKRFTPSVPTSYVKVKFIPVTGVNDDNLDDDDALTSEDKEHEHSDEEFLQQFTETLSVRTGTHLIGVTNCNCNRTLKLEHSQLYVIVLKIRAGEPGVIYQNEEGLAYYRRNGSNRMLPFDDIARSVSYELDKIYPQRRRVPLLNHNNKSATRKTPKIVRL